MMNNLKIGDKVKLKKLSEKEFYNFFPVSLNYNEYLKYECKYFDEYGIIVDIHQFITMVVYEIKFKNENLHN